MIALVSQRLFFMQQTVQRRQRESGRFASAGLGTSQHIVARKNKRNCLALNGSGGRVTLTLDGGQEFGAQPHLVKIHSSTFIKTADRLVA